MGISFEYDLRRSKRKSIAIHVKDGVVTVRAPLRADTKIIESFLTTKENWILSKLNEYAQRQSYFSDIIKYDSFPYIGNRLNVMPYAKKKVTIRDGTLYVPEDLMPDEQSEKSPVFLKALRRAYKSSAKTYLENRLQYISEQTGLKYNGFGLTESKAKWGSCDSYNNIKLNWHLVLLDESLINYVIVHELAHTAEHNHSKRFWHCVSMFYPNYKQAVACLKDASVLIKW